MKKLRSRRPSPALVVATAALVVSLTGGAIAGVATISGLDKKGKKTVSKIADRQIDARAPGIADSRIDAKAPGLSVKQAAVAGNASNQEWAIVNANGTLFRATPGITTAGRESDGKYTVFTNRDLTNCYFMATLGGNTVGAGLRGDISVNRDSASNAVYVLTSVEGGTPQNADRPFTLLIRC